MAVSLLLDFVPGVEAASFFSAFALLGSRSDLLPFGVPAAVFCRFTSSPEDFWLAFFVGGSSLLVADANFLFFFVLPESSIGVVGRLLDLGALVSPFSAASAEAAMRCRIRADDGCVVSVLDAVFNGVVVGVLDELAGVWDDSFADVPDSAIDVSFSVDSAGCETNGGGKAAGGFARDTLSQLVENHLESAGTRRLLLIWAPPVPGMDVESMKPSHPL